MREPQKMVMPVKQGWHPDLSLKCMQLPDAPTNAPVFMEDLPEEEQDVTGYAKYGAGA